VYLVEVGFEVLTAVSMKIAVFWVVLPDYTVLQPRRQQSSSFYLVEVYRRFRDACYLHRPDDGGSKHL
jgi:hypothetical protein